MTDTEKKLSDAAVQMKLALGNMKNENVLRSCINSFITHSRSVTFVMQAESAAYPELTAWYENRMALLKEIPLLRFFNAQRVHTIHKGVVTPTIQITPIRDIKINGEIKPGEGTMTFLRFEGVEEYIPGDSGGAIRLCEQYFIVMRTLVREWLEQRIILGIE